MVQYFKLFFVLITLCSNNYLYSATANKAIELSRMKCNDLMISFIFGSSYGMTMEKLDLSFAFERINENHIMIKVVRKIENHRMGVHSNLELDLVNETLSNIDGKTPKSIKVNTKYIPYISKKCTKEKNVYVNTGRLPDINGD